MDDGEELTIFCQVIVKPRSNQHTIPKVIFYVQFKVAGMTLIQNIRFSLIPIPIIGLSGFRSKL